MWRWQRQRQRLPLAMSGPTGPILYCTIMASWLEFDNILYTVVSTVQLISPVPQLARSWKATLMGDNLDDEGINHDIREQLRP